MEKLCSSARLGHWLVAACRDAKTCASYAAGPSQSADPIGNAGDGIA